MTDIETLIDYRIRQSEETLGDAKIILRESGSPRSVINRTYYSMFYAVMALLLKFDIRMKTSKHIGIMSLFDKEFVHSGKIDKKYTRILHKQFDKRQQGDYKEVVHISVEDAKNAINEAEQFLSEIKKLLSNPSI